MSKNKVKKKKEKISEGIYIVPMISKSDPFDIKYSKPAEVKVIRIEKGFKTDSTEYYPAYFYNGSFGNWLKKGIIKKVK